MAIGQAPDVDVNAIPEAVQFLRRDGTPSSARVRSFIIQLGLDPNASDCRLQLGARLRSVLTGERARVFDSILAGIPYKAVASMLGVSLRQFFRRRDDLLNAIGASLLESAATSALYDRLDDAYARLDAAVHFLEKGFPQSSASVSSELLRTVADQDVRSRAFSMRSRALHDVGDERGARDDLLHAAAGFETLPPTSLAEVAMTRSFLEYRTGFLHASINFAELAAKNWNRTDALKPADRRARIGHLHFLGVQHQESGSVERSVEVFLEARRLLYEFADPPRRELAENLAFTSISRIALPDQITLAAREAHEALRLAQWHGLERAEVWAHCALAIISRSAGKHQQSVQSARAALALAKGCLAGDELSRIYTMNTRIEIGAGNPDGAFDLLPAIRELRNVLAPFMAGITLLCEANVLQRCGDFDTARSVTLAAIEALEKRNDSHYIGLAYMDLACNPISADPSAEIEKAIAYLRKGALPVDLAIALELSAGITGNRAHATEARELRAAIAT